ncbi:MAG: hypothetical protein V3T81_08450 [Thermoanaerobaculia bacterium]
MRALSLSLLALLGLAQAAFGQRVLDITEDLDFDRPESWAMKYFTSVTLFTGMGVPRRMEPGSVEVGLEAGWVPTLSDRERTVGFSGTKTEELNRTSLFGRPRVQVGLPHGLSLTLSWVPPIEMSGVEPNLLAAALGRPLHDSDRWRLGLRVYAQYGTLEGDLTCSEGDVAGGDDPARNPFRCEVPSDDEMTLRSGSLEVSAAFPIGDRDQFEPYVALAGHYMDLDFQVNARYSGIIDHTLLLTDGVTASLTGGVRYTVSDRIGLSGEVFFTQLDVVRPPETRSRSEDLVNVRALVTYRVR